MEYDESNKKSCKDVEYDNELDAFTKEVNNVLFVSEEEGDDSYFDSLTNVADSYHKNLDHIIEFMLPKIKEVYGDVDKETVKEKLGKPVIDTEKGTITYLEQTFDNIHIFTLEFLDNEFNKLEFFTIDG